MDTNWSGIFPALTTKFNEDFSLDLEGMSRHIETQINAGVHGLIPLGTLGEKSSLSFEEKLEVVDTTVEASDGRVPVVPGVAETTTAEACRFVEEATEKGVDGFMVLPAMEYEADRRENLRHFRTVADAATLPLMIYNNPMAYNVDITPEMFGDLAEEPKFVAIKDSSNDVRRVTDIHNAVGERYQIFVGVDDLVFEAFMLGADGTVAGFVNAFPEETVALYELAKAGRIEEARKLYRWFTPLLHLDVSTKLVQNIKLAEAKTGLGTEHVRPPRLPLAGEERERVEALVDEALANRPDVKAVAT
jgi:4-hydroxy-tetrahydrodipicolinate synthase